MKQHPRKNWNFKTPDLDKSLKLAAELELPLLAGQLLVSRNITNPEDARTYLYPEFAKFKGFHDPFKLSGMDKAVERIRKAISRGEKICIYGDYDADGTTATALLLDTFREMDVPADYYIPDRFREGYGLTEGAVEEIREKKGAKIVNYCGLWYHVRQGDCISKSTRYGGHCH